MKLYKIFVELTANGWEIIETEWQGEELTVIYDVRHTDKYGDLVIRRIRKDTIMKVRCDYSEADSRIMARVWCLPEQKTEAIEILKDAAKNRLQSHKEYLKRQLNTIEGIEKILEPK